MFGYLGSQGNFGSSQVISVSLKGMFRKIKSTVKTPVLIFILSVFNQSKVVHQGFDRKIRFSNFRFIFFKFMSYFFSSLVNLPSSKRSFYSFKYIFDFGFLFTEFL